MRKKDFDLEDYARQIKAKEREETLDEVEYVLRNAITLQSLVTARDRTTIQIILRRAIESVRGEK